MKKNKNAITLAARVIGGIAFLAVFMLNVVLFVQSDGIGISLESLKAYAQTGGTNNEEEENGFSEISSTTKETKTNCLKADGTWGKVSRYCTTVSCSGTGTMISIQCGMTECVDGTGCK